jgi:hypothetical protein
VDRSLRRILDRHQEPTQLARAVAMLPLPT